MKQLVYQSLDDCHAAGLLPIWSDRDVIKYTNITVPYTLSDVCSRVKLLKESDVFVVKNKEIIIGIIGCQCLSNELQQFGIFYQFLKSSWGNGYATICMGWLLKNMKQKYSNAAFYADVIADNIASEKILIKYGFKLTSEDFIERNGKAMKLHKYVLNESTDKINI